jgi:hypothetical protein
MALGSTQPLVKMSTRNIPGDKGGRCLKLTTSLPSRAECREIWEPKPPGTLWATPGLLRDSFTFIYIHIYMRVCVYTYVNICVCMCIYTYICTYTHIYAMRKVLAVYQKIRVCCQPGKLSMWNKSQLDATE